MLLTQYKLLNSVLGYINLVKHIIKPFDDLSPFYKKEF